MQINESLRFFRKNNDQTLKDILPTKNNPKQSPSKLSRFELGTERVSIREFLEILDNVSIAPEEILKFSNTDAQTEQQQYITLSTLCMKKPNSSKKNALLKYYKHLDSKEKKTTRELSNLLSIKFHFSKLWKKDIPPISQAEIEQVNTHLLNRKYYTKYDYSLLLMICTLLPENTVAKLIRLMIPITDIEKRTPETKAYAYNSLRNIITTRLHENDLHNAQKYILIAKRQFSHSTDYRFKIHVIFLEYLLEYATKPEKLDYYSKIVALMSTLQEIGEFREIESMRSDLDRVIESKQDLKESLERSFAENTSFTV